MMGVAGSRFEPAGVGARGYSQGAAAVGYVAEEVISAGVSPAGIAALMPAALASHGAAVALLAKPSTGFLQVFGKDAPPVTVGRFGAVRAKTIDSSAFPETGSAYPAASLTAHTISVYAVNGVAGQAGDFAAHHVVSIEV